MSRKSAVSRVIRKGRRRAVAVATGLAVVAAAAAGGTVAGPAHADPHEPRWQSHAPAPPSKWTCATPKTLQGYKGRATATVCRIYYVSKSGTLYYQGALKVTYTQSRPGGSDVFSGKVMAGEGSGPPTSVTNCYDATWWQGITRWCYSPTVVYKGGGALWAIGQLTLLR